MGFNIVCVVREVLDTRDLAFDPVDSDGNLALHSLETRFDPEDLNALEMALRIKDQKEAFVQCLSIGSERKVDVLRECLYRGADRVVRLEDPAFVNLDTLSQSIVYGRAIQKLGSVDLVLTGIQIPEGENSSLGGNLAKFISFNLISYVEEIEKIDEKIVRARRAVEGGFETVESPLPVLITVGVALLKDDPRSPRSPKATLKLKHKKTPITTWGREDLMLQADDLEPVVMMAGYRKIPRRQFDSKVINGDDMDAIKGMLRELRKLGFMG